uniref:URB1 ribosome biogenesis homolog n=1 Tax=Tetraodon nigroviridis TaxID=99883 RepID=H3C620_TETNG
LSVYGHAAVQILTANSSLDRSIFLSQTHLHGLGTLFLSCSSPTLEAFVLQTLSDEPGSAKLVNKDVLLHCFRCPSHNTQAISSVLLQNCSTHLLCFEMWCLEPSNRRSFRLQGDISFYSLNCYVMVQNRTLSGIQKTVKKQVLKTLKQKLLVKLSQCVLGDATENSITQQTEALSSLIKISANVSDIRNLMNKLPTALQNVKNFERWKLIDVITEKLADFPQEKETWRKSVVTAAIKCLIASYSSYKDQTTSPSEQERSILERLCQHLSSSEDITSSEWNTFVRNGLKYRFKDHLFLNTLSSLLEVIYTDSEDHKDLVSLSTIHMMASTHSLFLPTMLDSAEEPKYSSKDALVSLLLCLVKKCPAVCTSNHFVVLLGAYGVTLSTLDQKILLLLQEYERNNVSLLKFHCRAFLWGPAAVEHHKTRKSLGASLWKQVSSDNLLALLNTDRMLQTVANFPQQRKMMTQENKGLIYTDGATKDLGNMYDPCFLLPSLSVLECVIDCLKFVSSHAMGVTVMALSSYDPKIRAAAYHVLSCFYQHLEGSQFREKSQLLYLMDMMRNGIRHPNQRLPFVMTTYVAKVAQQMLKPEDHMYVVLNRFLLSHQSLDFRRVPEFFKLFYGFDLEHKMEREWILHVLEEGMRDGQCFELGDKQGIFQILMGFGSSPLCDEHCQALIMKVLLQAARVTRAAYNLSKSCGLLTWIIQMAERKTVDQQLLSAIIDLVHVLWFTILGQKEKQMTADEKHQSSVKCLPLPLINDFLCVALTISRHLGLCVRPAKLCLLLQTLCSVLRYRKTALLLSTQAGRLTFPPQPLSSSEALSLLRCWAFLAHNTALITQIQDICEKHHLKELFVLLSFSVGKDKSQAKAHYSKAQSQRQNLAEDSETEKQQRSYLAECKTYLCGILVHWEPVIPVSEPQLVNSQHGLGASALAREAAHQHTKRCLRCLVEEPYDENRTEEFLFWAKKAVLEHKEIMNVVLDDSGWRADLLRLHHHTEVHCRSSIPSRVETFQTFTDIMMCLLEAKGNLPVLHQIVAAACQAKSRSEAGLFLLSLYVSEMWSGATATQMFLSHVSLVAKCKRQKNKSASQTSLKAICEDISSSISTIARTT